MFSGDLQSSRPAVFPQPLPIHLISKSPIKTAGSRYIPTQLSMFWCLRTTRKVWFFYWKSIHPLTQSPTLLFPLSANFIKTFFPIHKNIYICSLRFKNGFLWKDLIACNHAKKMLKQFLAHRTSNFPPLFNELKTIKLVILCPIYLLQNLFQKAIPTR